MSRGSLAPADRAQPAPLDEEMRAALRQVPASVAIVTTGRGEAALGMTATSVTSVSLAPPALLVCVNRVLRLNAAMRANGRFQISYLRRGQEDIARAFILDPAVAVELEVHEIYLQTPGPGAGTRIAPPLPEPPR